MLNEHVIQQIDAVLAEAQHRFCSTQLTVDDDVAKACLLRAGRNVPDAHLGTEGREDTPHLTVQYGIHEADGAARLVDALRGFGPIRLVLGRTELFPGSVHSGGDSVLYVAVKEGADRLVSLRERIREHVTVTDNFPEYIPHLCLAYVKAEFAEQYEGQPWVDGTEVVFNSVDFSDRDRNVTVLMLTDAPSVTERALTSINRLLEP